MRNYITRVIISLTLLSIVPVAAWAQESSINTFSPYTLYGLGNLAGSGGSTFVAMGGASIGFRNGGFDTAADIRLNTSNPASLSGITPKTFIFDVGFAGSNVYLRENNATLGTLNSSFNTFNINNITVAFPLARRLGLAVNVSPYSQVGYRIHQDDHNINPDSPLADLGIVRYFYDGEGDVSEAKLSVGWEPFKNFSIGAEMIYMWGNIDRSYKATVVPYTGSGTYGSVSASTNEKISRIFGAFGVQYTPLSKARSRLTIGATYRLGGRLNSTVTDFIPSGNIYGDTVRFVQKRSAAYMPQMVGTGIYFHRPKWSVGADYVWQNWGRNGYDAANSVRYVDTHTYKIGIQYTPNRYDIRGKGASFFNRMTYKVGFRYNNNYQQFRGNPVNDKAITLGFDIPFAAMTVSNVSVGFELGERGTLRNGLVRERYFKFNVGVMLFGRDYDYWFEKYKYN